MEKAGWIAAALVAVAALSAWLLRPRDGRVGELEAEVRSLRAAVADLQARAKEAPHEGEPARTAPSLHGASEEPAGPGAHESAEDKAFRTEWQRLSAKVKFLIRKRLDTTPLGPRGEVRTLPGDAREPVPEMAANPSSLEALAIDPKASAERRIWAIGALGEQDAERAADVTERLLGSRDEADRRVGVAALSRATNPAFLRLVDQRLKEPDVSQDETRSLLHARAWMKDRPWSALQATGEPDTTIGGDIGTAWASKRGDMGLVTLDLGYDRAVRPDAIRIYETLNPGAVSQVLVRAPDGSWEPLWSGEAPVREAPTVFSPALAGVRYATNEVRLVLDTNRVPGWNEIDAVELVGDGVRQFATSANASSSYSDP
jgi:hypothetical protein